MIPLPTVLAELVAPKSDEGGFSQKIVRQFFRCGGEAAGSLEMEGNAIRLSE